MSQNNLNSLNYFNNTNKPSWLDSIYYLFFDKGITLVDLDRLPLPYILGILRTHSYIKDEEEKELKKARRKR